LKNTERERRIVTDVFMKLLTGSAAGTGASAGPAASSASTAPAPGASGATGAQQQQQQQPSSSSSAVVTTNPSRGMVLSPSELLIQLHTMEDAVGWKAACEGKHREICCMKKDGETKVGLKRLQSINIVPFRVILF
jgi:hypothetical protein